MTALFTEHQVCALVEGAIRHARRKDQVVRFQVWDEQARVTEEMYSDVLRPSGTHFVADDMIQTKPGHVLECFYCGGIRESTLVACSGCGAHRCLRQSFVPSHSR